MSESDLILQIHAAGVTLDAVDGRVRYRVIRGALPDELRRAMKEWRSALLAIVLGRRDPRPSIRTLANEYRHRRGDGFREALLAVIGVDFHLNTPSWLELQIFLVHMNESPAPTCTSPERAG